MSEPRDRGQTHFVDCWQTHHECAIAEVERLRASLATAEAAGMERLTLNELALAECGADLAVAWWKSHQVQSAYSRAEIAKYIALRKKLDAILNKFSLPANEEGEQPDNGEDTVRLIWDRAALSQDRSAGSSPTAGNAEIEGLRKALDEIRTDAFLLGTAINERDPYDELFVGVNDIMRHVNTALSSKETTP